MSPPAPETHSSPGAQQVLDAARALFAEQGVDAVSMQDIATRAGVSKANVFHHFASKEALYVEVIRACAGHQSADIEGLIASTAPFEQRFQALMLSQLRDMLNDPCGTRLVIREVTNGNVERAKLIATQIFSDKIRARVAFFEDARSRGELRPGMDPHVCDMLLCACCMFHINCGAVSKHLSDELGSVSLHTPEAYARVMSSALSAGFGVSGLPQAAVPKAKPARKTARKVSPATAAPKKRVPQAPRQAKSVSPRQTKTPRRQPSN